MPKINVLILILTFLLLANISKSINYYPDYNQYAYTISMFNSHTLSMTFTTACTSFTLTSKNGNSIDYFWDSVANAVIVFRVVYLNEIITFNCNGVLYDVDLRTVDTTTTITLQKPTTSDLAVSLNTGTWTYNPTVTVTTSLNNPVAITDIRYAWYIYKYNDDITPNSNSMLCSGNDILTTSNIIPISCNISSNEGDRLYVAVLAYHWYYNLKDTLSFTIIPRNDHKLFPSPGDINISLAKFNDSQGLVTSYRKQFSIVRSDTGGVYNTINSPYIMAVHWTCSCIPSVTGNCSIDQNGMFTINDMSAVTSFSVTYAINICHYGVYNPSDGSTGDVIGGNSCSDTITNYITSNPKQTNSQVANTFTFLTSTTIASKGTNIPSYLSDTTMSNKNYVPIVYYLDYSLPTVSTKFVEYNLTSGFSTPSNTCTVTTTLATSTNVKSIEILSQTGMSYFSASGTNLQCSNFRDNFNWSEDVSVRSYLESAANNSYFNAHWTFTLNPRIYHAGNLFMRNSLSTATGIPFFCNYVNKFYVFSYSNYTDKFTKIRNYLNPSGIFNPVNVNFNVSPSAFVVISNVSTTNAYPVIRDTEQYDIIYVIWANGPSNTCTLNSYNFTGSNQILQTIFPAVTFSTGHPYQPKIYNLAPVNTLTDSTTTNIASGTIRFYAMATCTSTTNLQHCNLFAQSLYIGNTISSITLTTLVDPNNTYTSLNGIRWFTFDNTDSNITVDQYTGLMTISNPAAFFAKTQFYLHLAVLISDEKRRGTNLPNNFALMRYLVNLSYNPNFYFSGLTFSTSPVLIDSLNLITTSSTHYCCLKSSCPAADISNVSTLITTAYTYYLCRYSLFPDLVNTIPLNLISGNYAGILFASLTNPEYSSSVVNKLRIDPTGIYLYHVIDTNQYMTDRFRLTITDKIGSVECINLLSNAAVPTCTGKTFMNSFKTLETYILYKNFIRISVPNRQKVLQFHGPSGPYTVELEINKPSGAGSITCNCYNSNANFNITCTNKNALFDQLILTVTQVTYDLNQLDISVYCNTASNASNQVVYFGVNNFSLFPNASMFLYNDFFLLAKGTGMTYTPNPADSWNTSGSIPIPNQGNGANMISYRPYMIEGEKFPYTFHNYNYKTGGSTWTTYNVINWNASSIKYTTTMYNHYFCCISSSNPGISCSLTNTSPRSPLLTTEPINTCTFITGNGNLLNGPVGTTGYNYNTWFDTLTCDTVNLNSTPNSVQCFDDVLSLNCMPVLPSGTISYTRGYIFKQNIKFCVHNVPRLVFLSTIVSSEVINGVDWILDITKYIDMRNILDGFIRTAVATEYGNFSNSLSFISYDEINNLVGITASNFATIFITPPTPFVFKFNFQLIDSYDRVSTNTITFTLTLNNCPTFNRASPFTLPVYWYPGYPEYGYYGYTNSFTLFDSSSVQSDNIISTFNDDVMIETSPQLFKPPTIQKIAGVGAKTRSSLAGDMLVEIWWDAPKANVYTNSTIKIILKLNCPNPNFTPYRFEVNIQYYAEVPFPNFIPQFKPFIKCIINSSTMIIYNNVVNDILAHFDPSPPSVSKIVNIEGSYLNNLLYGAANFPNTSSDQVTVTYASSKWSLRWPMCQDASTTLNVQLSNISVTDPTIPSPISQTRGFIIFKNKFYIEMTSTHGHKFTAYYRYFPYATTKFNPSLFQDTFVTPSSVYSGQVYFDPLTPVPNDVAIITDTCLTNGGMKFMDIYQNVSGIMNFYPTLQTTDNSNSSFPSINTTNLCGLYEEMTHKYYITTDQITSGYLDVKFNLYYFPHYAQETDTMIQRFYNWDKNNINFRADVYDLQGNVMTQQLLGNNQPTNILVLYGVNLNSFMQLKFTYTLSDINAKFLPVINVNVMDTNIQIYDTITNTFVNSINPKVVLDPINRTVSIDFAKSQLNPNADNYKITIHANYSVKSHYIRWDYLYPTGGVVLKLYSDDLENLRNVNYPSYNLFNSFYLNLVFVPQKLYMTINRIDPVTLVTTKICEIDDINYYSQYQADLSDYYNSSAFKSINSCNQSTNDLDFTTIQLYLKNISDWQDYVYTLYTVPVLPNCNGMVITQSMLVGDFLPIDLPAAKVVFPAGSTTTTITFYINVVHKNFNILTTGAYSRFNYLKMLKIQHWLNFCFTMTISKKTKSPRVQKFWTTSQLIYDSPSNQFFWATENVQYVYNFWMLSDNNLTSSDMDLWAIDRHNPIDQSIMAFKFGGCTPFPPSCTPTAQQEDYNFTFRCLGTFKWTPNTYQYDSSLVVLKMKDSTDSNLFSYYYFNVGMVSQQNDMPKIHSVLCQEVSYNQLKMTNQQTTSCSTDPLFGGRYILSEYRTYIIKLMWSDTDSYPINPKINSELSYDVIRANSNLPLYPPYLTFSMSINPPETVTGFTQLTYDTWKIRLEAQEMYYVGVNNFQLDLSYTIQDDMWDLNSTGSATQKITQTLGPVKFSFSVVDTHNVPYVKDTFNLGQYDSSFWLIPRVFFENMGEPSYGYSRYSFSFTLYNVDFITFPNRTFNYNVSVVNCPALNQNSDLKFEDSTGVDSFTKTFTIIPTKNIFNIKMTWLVLDNNVTFNTAGCQIALDDSIKVTNININACQYFWCRFRNIIHAISGACQNVSTCIYKSTITLTGQNFPPTTNFGPNGSNMMIANAECNDPSSSANGLSMTCTLPNIGGRNQLIWLWRDPNSNASGFPAYQITYPEPFATVPKINLFYLFKSANYYYVNYPKPLNVYGQNFRASCQCVMTCNGVDYYPRTNVKSNTFIECDYLVLNKSVYFLIYCSLNIRCLDHPSYKSHGDVYDLTKAPGDILYTSAETLMVLVDEVTYTRVNFKGFSDQSLTEDYVFGGSFKPHRHGGYIIQVTYSKTPECLKDLVNGCNQSYIYIKITKLYVLKGNCQTGNDGVSANVFFCQIISPIMNNPYLDYMIQLSWDYGLTFTDLNHSPVIELGSLCSLGYYCPAYKIIPVDKGYFCDNIPINEESKYCRYQRKCMAGFYTDQPMQPVCKPVPPGYYLNYFGSDNKNVPMKICPKGYICREYGLPKFYEICRPGHRCLYEGLYQLWTGNEEKNANDGKSDQFCMTGNYCALGTLWDKPHNYSYEEAAIACDLPDFFNPATNVYDYKLMQRLFSFKFGISIKDNNNVILDLCAIACKYFTSGIRSKKGNYRPKVDCAAKVYPDPTPANLFNNGTKMTALQMYQTTTDANKILVLAGVKESYEFSCYYRPNCYMKLSVSCCNEGACWCPPGFGCDVDDLRAPILCEPGTWRFNYAENNVPSIKSGVDANIFDFIDLVTDLYKAYSNYYMDKYGTSYISVQISDYYGDRQSGTGTYGCILCPPGYYCPRGSIKPIKCDSGTYCEHQFAEPLKCKQGYYNDQAGMYMCKPCPPGKICPTEGLNMAKPCPAGYYCPRYLTGTIDQNYNGTDFEKAMPCPENYYCPGDSAFIGSECPMGNRCPANTAQPIPCTPGYFQNYTTRSFCYDCPRGYYCMSTSLTEPKECDPGRICNSTRLTSSSKICWPGYICDGRVGLLPNDDILLDYNSKYTAKQMKQCDPGYYCNAGTVSSESKTGQIDTPQKCNPGEYNGLPGQSKCTLCPAGFECVTPGLTQPIPCKKGFYRDFDPRKISCLPCPDGTFGDEPGYDTKDKCISCPPGVVCVATNMTTDIFTTLDDRYWRLCPEGYICPNATNLANMNLNACPSGRFCVQGAQTVNDSKPCPAGRICPKATAVTSKDQVLTCAIDDPNYCYIGEVCEIGYFCPTGTKDYTSDNSCFSADSFKGSRERFFCSRTVAVWDNFEPLPFTLNGTEYVPIYSVNITRNSKISDARRILQTTTNQTSLNSTSNNNTLNNFTLNNSTINNSTNTNTTNKSTGFVRDPRFIYEIPCLTVSVRAYEVKYINFDMSRQNGFLPDHYDFIFKVKQKVGSSSSSFYMFEKNYYGTYGEVPLFPDAKLYLMRNDYKFTIKILAQEDISVSIFIQYFQGAFFSYYYNNTILNCESLVQVAATNMTLYENLIGKNLLHFFSISKVWISGNMNIPNNMMTYKDIDSQSTKYLYPAAISLHNPKILDFVNYTKYSKADQNDLDPKTDYYVHKTCHVSAMPDQNDEGSLFGSKPDIQKFFGSNTTKVMGDNLITTYMPYISNCEHLGNHITFKNMLEHPKCNLVSANNTITYAFLNFFASATADECDYTVKCFYDERFDSNKVNWMQYDYGINKLPLMNISQYAMNPDIFQDYVKERYAKEPDQENDFERWEEIMNQVPVKVTTNIGALRAGDDSVEYLPTTVIFTIIYYIQSDTNRRKIVKASLQLTDFERISDKESIEKTFKEKFNANKTNSVLGYKVWQFFRDSSMFGYMGDIANYMMINYYQSTTQYGLFFSNFTDYKKLSQLISDADVEVAKSQTQTLAVNLGTKPTVANLNEWIAQLAQKYFATAKNTIIFKSPPILPIAPTQNADIYPQDYVDQYQNTYKDYMNNAYVISKHIYNFHVIIRPANWLEALNYQAFPLDQYVSLSVIILMIFNVNYFFYYMAYQVRPFGMMFRVSWNVFAESKLAGMKFYEDYMLRGKSAIKALLIIIKNNIVASMLVSFPATLIIGVYFSFFALTGWFRFVPANYMQKPADYQVVENGGSDSAVEAMLLTNVMGRIGVAYVFIGLFMLFLGVKAIKPPYDRDLVSKNLIKDIQVKRRDVERLEVLFKMFMTIFLMMVIIYEFLNFFFISNAVEFWCILFYQLVIFPVIYAIFDDEDGILVFLIHTILSLANYVLIISCTKLNNMLLLFLLSQFIKFFRIVFNDYINRFFKGILNNTILKKSKKQLLIEKIRSEDGENQEGADDNETAALVGNMKIMALVCSDIGLAFILTPTVGGYMAVLKFVLGNDPDKIFNVTVFLIVVAMGFGLDIINYTFIFVASRIRDGCCGMQSIMSEAAYIYKERNAPWSLASTVPINKPGEYRKMDKKYDSLRMTGFTTQLFIINLLFGMAFNMIFFGMNCICQVRFIPWYDVTFFGLCLLFIISFKIIWGLFSGVGGALKVWNGLEIRKRMNDTMRKLKEDTSKTKDSDGESSLNSKTLDAMIAQVRNKIGDIWGNELLSPEEKKSQITELLKDVKIHSALHDKSRKELTEELVKRSKKDLEEKKNKNMAGHSQSYDNIPNISIYYSNLSVYNFNREVNLILNEMTRDRLSNLMSLENRYKVRYDIMHSLNLKMPDRFLEDIGVKEKKRDPNKNPGVPGNVISSNDETEDNVDEFYMNSKYAPSRPVFQTGLQTDVINNRKTTFRNMITLEEQEENE